MSKMALWKRFGGLLGRGHKTAEVVEVDSEGLLVEPAGGEEDSGQSDTQIVQPQKTAEQKLEAVEDGFNQMVDILGSIDETLNKQREQQDVLHQRLSGLPEVLGEFPKSVSRQVELFGELSGQLQEQSVRQQEAMEVLREIPEVTRGCVERLSQLCEQGNQSAAAGTRMLEGVQGQQGTLENISQLLERNDTKLEALLLKQQKRFTWLIVSAMVVSVSALGAVIYLILRIN